MGLFKRYYPVLVAVLVAVLPLGMNTYWTEVAVNVGLYALLALSLNVILGQAGIFHMGHAAFYAVGAYVTAILNTHYQIPILLLIPVAGAAAALFALIVARPIIHLRGDYLLIVTIGIVEIVRIALINDVFGLTGGANGIFGIARPELFGIKIRKAIQFLLGSNMSEVLGVFTATLLGFVILEPVHLLWINLITDCFPALALGLEKGEPDTMTRPPRDSKDGIFAGGLGFDILYQGVLITIITMTSYIIGHCMEVGYFEMPKGVSDDGMTMAFLTMSMCEIFHSFNMRSQRKSVFSLPSHNKVLWGAMIGSLALTTLVLEVPVIANAFGFTPVSWTEYGVALALAFLVLPVVELVKLIQRRAARRAK